MGQNRIDVALVNPGNRTQIYQGLGARFAAVEPPVWVGLIASFIRKQGYMTKPASGCPVQRSFVGEMP